MKLLYFAQARQLAGVSEETWAPPAEAALDAQALWAEVLRRHPALAPLRPHTRLARNGEFAPADAAFAAGDEVALIPPVSGG
jgi:molybdopterin converting factor subunit 1